MESFSFDPVDGIGYDANDESDALGLHKRFSNGKDQLFIIGVTNNLIGENVREISSDYRNQNTPGQGG